ncbi:hypothetical protein [Lacticaseibacillus brantae]|uniref:DUF2922 domain-containing protein n=1 Tax=Lacticaseibacillus brantae DSM 23927 TaxID=1423727 RepID=A0A0R2AZY6_9LACO|nr:hypothetical protein [Lacticaseibacillus brantae]KRM72830.1 hypothetical protein FC34_GL000541 [Lacticaseibacillus brantae DSM 23927]
MKKKTMKQMLKAKKQTFEYFYITFTDGTTFELPVDVTEDNMKNHDTLLQQLRDKRGSLTAADGREYNFRDVVRYEFQATKRQAN